MDGHPMSRDILLIIGTGILTSAALFLALIIASYRAYRRDTACPTHGRKCPGHVHFEDLGDVIIWRHPDGEITVTTKGTP